MSALHVKTKLRSQITLIIILFLITTYANSQDSTNILKAKASILGGNKPAFILEIQGTQEIKYSTMFIEANQQNQHRFLIDIPNTINRIKTDNLYAIMEGCSGPILLKEFMNMEDFPISNLVAAQNSIKPPITRIVFYLKEKILPTIEKDKQILRARVPINIGNINNGHYEEPSRETLEIKQIALENIPSEQPLQQGQRPNIIESIKPIYLPKTTQIAITSDSQLKIKQVRLSKGGILRIDMYNATTTLPKTISLDKGILKKLSFEETGGDLSIYINLTEPVIYELESNTTGLVITFQNPLLEQLVSINANDEPLSSVLLMLFTQYGANIIAGSDVSGKVTARLVDVPLKAALDEILKAEGFGYLEEGGLIRVLNSDEIKEKEVKDVETVKKPPETNSKVFQLKYAKATDIQQLVQKIMGNDVNVLTDQRTNTLIIVATMDGEAFQEKAKKIDEMLVRLDIEIPEENKIPVEQAKAIQEMTLKPEIVKRIFKLRYLDPEKAKTILTPLLSEKGTLESVIMKQEENSSSSGSGSGRGGSGSQSSGGGGAFGSDMLLGEAVGQGGYVVICDIKEVIENIESELAKLDVPTPQVEIEAFIVEGSLGNDKELGVDWSTFSKSDELSLSFSGDRGLVFTKGIIPVEKFTGILNILANNNKLKVISNPTITTLEGQPAMFHSGDRIPYSRIYIQDGIEQIDTVFEEVGIVLAATPYVKDDLVSLVLSTSVSSESGFTPAGQPRISTRTTKSQVLIKSGDTVVIAGLNAEKDNNTVSKVPLIGDIPILGKVFTSETSVKQRSEVTIFITPRIVANATEGGAN